MEDLPPELLLAVVSNLAKHDLLSLCLTSKICMAAADEVLYQDVIFDKNKYFDIPTEKIEKYCKRATFALGNEEGSGFDQHDHEDDIEARLAKIGPSDFEAEGDEVFQALAYLRKVRELIIEGNRRVNIGRFAKVEHGFSSLKILRLQNGNMRSLDLPRFSTFLRYQSVTTLHGRPIIAKLSENFGPKSLALDTIILESSVLPFEYLENLVTACKSLKKFEFCAEDGMPCIDTVSPYQLITLLARHGETLQYLHIDYGLLQEECISRPEDQPWNISNGLIAYSALKTLEIEYDALFGSEKFTSLIPKEINKEILPSNIRTLKIFKCPPTTTTGRSVRLIVDHMQRHSVMDDVTIHWFCNQDEQETNKSAAIQVIEQARRQNLPIQMTYLDE